MEVDEVVLDQCVREALAREKGDAALFDTVKAKVMQTLTKPLRKVVMPSFEMLPPGTKQPEPPVEEQAAMTALRLYWVATDIRDLLW